MPSEDEKYYRQPWMTSAQWEAADCVALVVGGHHHMKQPKPCGDGVRVGIFQNELATFDFSYLTRIVIAAHARAVRLAVVPAGSGLAITAHYRGKRDGSMAARHPTIEEAIAEIQDCGKTSALAEKGGAR